MDYDDCYYSNQPRNSQMGLQNVGNTCFMNSGLQCLASVKALTHFFLDQFKLNNDLSQNDPQSANVVKSYYQFVKAKSNKQSSYTPQDIKDSMGQIVHYFQGSDQQDAFDLMTCLLNALNNGLNKIRERVPLPDEPDNYYELDNQTKLNLCMSRLRTRSQSIITDLFYACQTNDIKCLNCKKSLLRFQPYAFLTLPIPQIDIQVDVLVVTQKQPFLVNDKAQTMLKVILPVREGGNQFAGTVQYPTANALSRNLLTSVESWNQETVHKFRLYSFQDGVAILEPNDKELDAKKKYLWTDFGSLQTLKFKCQLAENSRKKYEITYFYADKTPTITEMAQCLFGPFSKDHLYVTFRRQFEERDGYFEAILSKTPCVSKMTLENWRSYRRPFQKANELTNQKVLNFRPDNEEGVSLDDCFALFSAPSLLSAESDWKCSNTQCDQLKPQCQFISSVFNLPKVLVIHLRRFHHVGSHFEKLFTTVRLKETLKAGDLLHDDRQKEEYQLVAVACHMGRTVDGGHYYALCRCPFTSNWFKFDDSRVSSTTVAQVLSNPDVMFAIYESESTLNATAKDWFAAKRYEIQ